MMYAIVESNSITAIGPYRELWPGVDFFSTGPDSDWLAAHNAVVIRSDPPYNPETQCLQRSEPYLSNGEVFDHKVITRQVTIKTPPEYDVPTDPKRFDTFTAPDGTKWIFDQPRNPDGTYASNDPLTPEIESALAWYPASEGG